MKPKCSQLATKGPVLALEDDIAPTNTPHWTSHASNRSLTDPVCSVPKRDNRVRPPSGEVSSSWLKLRSEAGRCMAMKHKLEFRLIMIAQGQNRIKSGIRQDSGLALPGGEEYFLTTPAERYLISLSLLLMRQEGSIRGWRENK